LVFVARKLDIRVLRVKKIKHWLGSAARPVWPKNYLKNDYQIELSLLLPICKKTTNSRNEIQDILRVNDDNLPLDRQPSSEYFHVKSIWLKKSPGDMTLYEEVEYQS